MREHPVLIVGGGIAGLATAAGLARAGVPCEVVERAEAWAPVGAGIVLGVNAMAVMRGLGLDEAVVARGARLARGAITDARGRALARTDFSRLELELGPTVALHRADLHEVLLKGAADVPIALGVTVDRLEPADGHVDVRRSDGREARYRLVIGADGLRSRVRELVFGDERVRYAGYTCWRFVARSPLERVELREMWGRGQRFGLVPVGGGRVYGFAVANAPRGEPDPEEGRLARLRERFAGFGGDVPAILASLDASDAPIHNDLEELAEGPWHDGRVLLVGDAAHALTPNMGQGAAMALEDAAVLVELLREGCPAGELGARLHARRADRVRWVQRQSRRIGSIGQLEAAWACRLRNAVLRAVPDAANLRALRTMASRPI
jgi:2-polyprenyl-6-methoxyphenol hydroxylase-like FAD-dependent oxidoreductase